MLIRVMYKDGSQELVKPAQLQKLIQKCQIKRFKRFSGWVSVICDGTREKWPYGVEEYAGRKRRKDDKSSTVFSNEPFDI